MPIIEMERKRIQTYGFEQVGVYCNSPKNPAPREVRQADRRNLGHKGS